MSRSINWWGPVSPPQQMGRDWRKTLLPPHHCASSSATASEAQSRHAALSEADNYPIVRCMLPTSTSPGVSIQMLKEEPADFMSLCWRDVVRCSLPCALCQCVIALMLEFFYLPGEEITNLSPQTAIAKLSITKSPSLTPHCCRGLTSASN